MQSVKFYNKHIQTLKLKTENGSEFISNPFENLLTLVVFHTILYLLQIWQIANGSQIRSHFKQIYMIVNNWACYACGDPSETYVNRRKI